MLSFELHRARSMVPLVSLLFLAAFSSLSTAATVSPDFVDAVSTEHSPPFAAVNTINGSGLPNGFSATDAHANYARGNHWTTSRGTIPTDQSITWGFNAPTTLGAIYIWNHRSNVIAANSGYEPTLFDLTFFDAARNVIRFIDDIALAPDTSTGQTFGIGGLLIDVSFVRFDIEAVQSSPSFTGLAEVAFETSVVPIPATVWLFISGLALIGLKRRKRV